MAIDTKTDLIKEIEAFSKALYDYSEIGDEIIAISKFHPYYSEQGILKRNDYSGEILDEEAFLVFYGLFFDMIELNLNAEKVSDSQYFNTLYHDYLKETKQDTFLQSLGENKENKDEAQSLAILNFFSNLLMYKGREIQEELKSKASPEKQLFKVISGKYSYEETMQLLGALDIATLFGVLLTISINIARKENFLEWLIPVIFIFIIPINLGLLIYWLKCKGTKSENKELKDLPANFKSYVGGGLIITSEDFFSPITFDYLDDFLNDSEVYLYLKEKYNKRERKNGIVNE
jgi:hypothetical protein